MRTSIRKSSITKIWCALAGLGASLITGSAAPPEIVQATGVYVLPLVQEEHETGKMLHITTVAPAVLLNSDNELIGGMLTWKGDFTEDAEGNFVGSGTGEITPFAGGKWVTHFEVRGNLATSYKGKVLSHGVEGAVEGMVTVMEFEGAPGSYGGLDTIVETYTGLLVKPKGGK